MIKKIKGKLKKSVLLIGLCAGFLTGCGSSKKELLVPDKEEYVKSEHVVETVMCGDLESSFSLTLKGKDYTRIDYSLKAQNINQMLDNHELTFDGCYVTKGQKVKKGDLLISYTSKKLDDEVKSYQDEIDSNNSTIEHYRRLMNIDGSVDYSDAIEKLEDRNEVLYLYKKEADDKRKDFKIYAEEDGTISFIFEDMIQYWGYIWTGSDQFIVMTESTGSSIFSVKTDENYDFKIGDVYEATTAINTYRMKLTAIDEDGDKKALTFEPEDPSILIPSDAVLTMRINRPVMKNVVYVNTKAVHKTDDERYIVYVLDEDGFRHATVVETGNIVEGKIIISSGLTGGELVSLD